MIKLKPCPFCGGKAVWCREHEVNHDCYFIDCTDCNGTFDMSYGSNPESMKELRKDCATAWNKRAKARKNKSK